MAKNSSGLFVVIVIIAILVLAYFAYFKPPATRGDNLPLAPAGTASQRYVETYSFASAFPVQGTNVTLRQNTTIVNGLRADIITLANRGEDVVALNVLVWIPKELASSSAQVQASHDFVVLREDPCGYWGTTITSSGTIQRAVSLTTTDNAPIMVIPTTNRDSAFLEQVCQVLDRHSAFFLTLRPEGLPGVARDLKPYVDRGELREFNAYLQTFVERAPPQPSQQPQLTLPRIPPFEISVYAPSKYAFLNIPASRSGMPNIMITGEASNYVHAGVFPAFGNEVTISLGADFTQVIKRGGEFAIANNVIRGQLLVSYPEDASTLSQPLSTNLEIKVLPVPNLFQASPSQIPGHGVVFITNTAPFGLDGVDGCELNYSIDLPGTYGASLGRSPQVVALYLSQQSLADCRFFQNARPIGYVSAEESPRPTGSPLYPTITEIADQTLCTENYCTCDAAKEAVLQAVQRVKDHLDRYLGELRVNTAEGEGYHFPGSDGLTHEFSILNTADMRGCDLGYGLTGVASNSINVLDVGVSPVNRNQVVVKTFNSPENFATYSTDPSVTPEQVVAAITQPSLCYNPNGLPTSKPEGCSEPQAVAVGPAGG